MKDHDINQPYISFGQRLLKIQTDHSLTNKEMTAIVQVHETTWSRYLHDHGRPKQEVVDIICQKYHVNYLWITQCSGEVYEVGYIPSHA